DGFRFLFVKDFLLRNPDPRGRPHVCNVNILVPVVVKIKPAHPHASANVFYTSVARDRGEGAVTIVAIEIVSPEIVGNVEVRPAISVVVAPGTGEAVAIVVDVQPGGLRFVPEFCIPFVAEQEVRRSVARIKIGRSEERSVGKEWGGGWG